MLLQQIFTLNEGALKDAMALCKAGDALLFAADGCYHTLNSYLDGLPPGINMYILNSDMIVRGLTIPEGSRIKQLEDTEWVELVTLAQQVKSWV